MNNKLYKYCQPTGPGGIRCPCCSQGIPVYHKKVNNRLFRRTGKKTIKESLDQG